ncbi:thyroid hormone receptor-associated protein 3 isoform X5 [Danio rerio]|uniref:Thyroid hormone receptor-associated protein 3 isoform X4 n=1 Tax=Danio rerio TaxID=7955 RepID=A0A0R4IWK3_DANRE|nr:thyroid hormone receptor-associated protein 3 isoform X3 [Danio rerio]|eukprot:XP_009290793.1 thyroid hormone receptor-associated protein 3 isoform X3 [Danio rerio]
MKKHIRSRSRSRSRSHSPPHNRERNHTREYQNQREFRGNHRGFRRPYYFRGRGQGFFRGRFQRGGRGGGYNNYRPKNWQNFRQHPQQQQQQYYHNSPKRGRSRSPKKQANSPKSRSHSRRSDRSSSGRSPQSHHSSSSNSGSAKRNCKNVREDVLVIEETQGGGDKALVEQVKGTSAAEGNVDVDRTLENCQVLMNHDSSPKRTSPQVCVSVTNDQPIDSTSSKTSPAQKSSNSPKKGATAWQNVETAPSNSSPVKKSTPPVFNGFGLFTNLDQESDDTLALSAAFMKFLEEQKVKKQASALENNRHKGKSNGDIVCDKENGGIFDKGIELSHVVDPDNTAEGKCKSAKSGDSNKLSKSAPKKAPRNSPPFQCEEGEDDEEMEFSDIVEDMENSPCKSKVTMSAREMFENRIRRMQDMTWDDELEALLLCHKQERASNILAALSKRDQLSGMFRDPSPEKLSSVKRKEKTTVSSSSKPTLPPRRSSENREQEMFVVMNEESPPRASLKRGSCEFSVRMDSLSDDLARTSVLTNERRNLMDFVHMDKKDLEFQSVLRHLQAQQFPRSPSELFAQHIVSIVHHIKAQYFPSSGLTLHDRFAMYQRRAAEKEFMKQRKSPEIHRRIDVSPSAFKRHSLLFDEVKSSMENSFKVDGKKSKGETMDLRLDIERRKKYLIGEREPREEECGGRVLRESPDSSKEIPTEKSSKKHKKSKKSKKKRERSQSSSSSSSSSSVYNEEEGEIKPESFSKVQLGLREYGEAVERGRPRGGFQLKIRGRSWNRGNFHGNSNGNSHMNMLAKNEGWDQEYTPKSKKHILHSEKDLEAERKVMNSRGRGRGNIIRTKGRFLLRRATNTTNNTSPKWAHDKFQATDDEGEQQREDGE